MKDAAVLETIGNGERKISVSGIWYMPGGALGYFLGGYVLPGTPDWHPILKKIPLKLLPCSRNGPIFYT